MHSIASRVLAVLIVFTATVAGAAEYSDLYIIPGASHARGAFGTLWRSDVVLHNIQSVPITVELALIESGRSPSTAPLAITAGGETTIHLNPGETRVLADVAGHFGRDITGALIAGADLPFAVTSRTYAEIAGGRTLGQTIAPVAISGSPDAVNESAVLPALAGGEGQRSNIGVFIAASHAPLVLELVVLSSSGAVSGSQVVVVDEPGFVHRQLALGAIAATMDSTAVVRILEGDGIVVPYASIVDNTSAEAVYVSAEAISFNGAASRGMLVTSLRSGIDR